jgi:hypothetical protein
MGTIATNQNYVHEEAVGATHSKSSASQSQSRNHQLLSNGSVNTFPRRYNSWIKSLLLGKTYNNIYV